MPPGFCFFNIPRKFGLRRFTRFSFLQSIGYFPGLFGVWSRPEKSGRKRMEYIFGSLIFMNLIFFFFLCCIACLLPCFSVLMLFIFYLSRYYVYRCLSLRTTAAAAIHNGGVCVISLPFSLLYFLVHI